MGPPRPVRDGRSCPSTRPFSPGRNLVSMTVESLFLPKTCIRQRAAGPDGVACGRHAARFPAASAGTLPSTPAGPPGAAPARRRGRSSAGPGHTTGTAAPALHTTGTKTVATSLRQSFRRRISASFSGQRRRSRPHQASVRSLFGTIARRLGWSDPGLRFFSAPGSYASRMPMDNFSAALPVTSFGHEARSSPDLRAFCRPSTRPGHKAMMRQSRLRPR